MTRHNASARRCARAALTIGSLAAVVAPLLADPPLVVEVDEVGPVALRAQPSHAKPRSLDLADAFTAGPDILLPALADEDVVGAGGGTPMINGRVYDWRADSDIDGVWTDLPDGSRLWTYAIAAQNAAGLRIRFEPFRPAPGTELLVYNSDDATDLAGPYSSRNVLPDVPLWTARTFGRAARIEWFIPAQLAKAGGYGALRITGVLQIFPDPPIVDRGGTCRIDATCHSEWNTTGLSVAHIEFVDGGDGFICSGALLNRTPTADFCPVFLTAAHCITSSTVATTVSAFWFFQTATCNGPAPSLGSVPRTDGATLLRRDSDPDICLLGLPEDQIPSGVVFAGWTSAEAPDPTSATLIHHPLGMRKSWSPGVLEGIETISQCTGTASTTYDFQLSNGGQDGGSSGAPVFDNANHRVRAVATCSESDNCIPAENTGEGSFADGYSLISPYLVPQGDIWVQSGWPGGETGSVAFPFNTLREGIFAVQGGGTIHIRPGTGYGPITINGPRAMTLTSEGGTARIGG